MYSEEQLSITHDLLVLEVNKLDGLLRTAHCLETINDRYVNGETLSQNTVEAVALTYPALEGLVYSAEGIKDFLIALWKAIIGTISMAFRLLVSFFRGFFTLLDDLFFKTTNLEEKLVNLKNGVAVEKQMEYPFVERRAKPRTDGDQKPYVRRIDFDTLGIKNKTVKIERGELFLYKNNVMGLDIRGISAVKTAFVENRVADTILHTGARLSNVLSTNSIRDKDDLLSFVTAFGAVTREYSDTLHRLAGAISKEGDASVAEIPIHDYPGAGRYLITFSDAYKVAKLDFIYGDRTPGSEVRPKSAEAVALYPQEVHEFVRHLSGFCSNSSKECRTFLKQMEEMDSRLVDAGKNLLRKMVNDIEEGTGHEYTAQMRACLNVIGVFSSSSKKAFTSMIKHATSAMSEAYKYSRACYDNFDM